jgi:hypothetical protein
MSSPMALHGLLYYDHVMYFRPVPLSSMPNLTA